MAVTGGSLLFLPRQLTLLILALAFMLLLKGRFQHSPLLPLTLALACYFLRESLFLHFVKDISYPAIRTSLKCISFSHSSEGPRPYRCRSDHVIFSPSHCHYLCLPDYFRGSIHHQ